MKKILIVSLCTTLPLQFFLSVILALIFPTPESERVKGVFELSLLLCFIASFIYFSYKKSWVESFFQLFDLS